MSAIPDIHRPILPVGLLIAGRRCLVVGAGRIGARKILSLLAAGAQVVVVAPELGDEARRLLETAAITHHPRPFVEQDVVGCALVITATDDGAVNRRVLAVCREHSIWCGAADKNWMHGDLMSPAVLRRGELVVSISTGGRSSRRSRMVKANLERHLALTEQAILLVIGTSHRELPQKELARFHRDVDARATLGRMILQLWGVHEFQILVTCNRIEVHAVVGEEQTTVETLERLLGFDVLPATQLYCLSGPAAFEHVVSVAAGLAAQTWAEEHIQGQLRAATAEARQAGWAGGMIGEWMAATTQAAATVRAAVKPLLRPQEIEDRCVARIAAHTQGRNTAILVLGSGTVGRGVVERLAITTTCRWCYHRQRPALPLVLRSAVELVPWEQLPSALGEATVVVCAMDASAVLTLDHAQVLEQVACVIDLGMPPNLAAPLVERLGDRVLDLDGLEVWHRSQEEDPSLGRAVADTALSHQRKNYDALINRLAGRNQS